MNKVFVGGLPHNATSKDLRKHFAQYAPIIDAVVLADRRTKRSRGFGFICFAGGADGARAVTAVMQDAAKHWLGGKWVEVKRATPAAMPQECNMQSSRFCMGD